MHTWLITPYLVLTGLLFVGLLQSAGAAPEVRVPAASKPKFVPRPVPGMGHHAPAPMMTLPVVASGSTAPRSQPAAAATSTGTPQTRILMVYRRGTYTIPGAEGVGLATPSPTPSGAGMGAPSIVPRPGQVRIITKAEAEALVAQPELAK
jgi:hypothetical protein